MFLGDACVRSMSSLQDIPYSLKISRIKNFEVFEDLSSTSKISSSKYLNSVTRVHSVLARVHVRNGSTEVFQS